MTKAKKDNDIVISSLLELKENIKPCRELKVFRDTIIPYYHHMFVSRADEHKLEIIHYGFTNVTDYLKCKYPAAIRRFPLVYDDYENSDDVQEIFNFNKGDTLIIVNRNDYPNTTTEIYNVIKRAESRIGEQMYSASRNNCESYVNWVLSGKNVSKQIQDGGVITRVVADAVDRMFTYGAEKPYTILFELGVAQVINTYNYQKNILAGRVRFAVEESVKIPKLGILSQQANAIDFLPHKFLYLVSATRVATLSKRMYDSYYIKQETEIIHTTTVFGPTVCEFVAMAASVPSTIYGGNIGSSSIPIPVVGRMVGSFLGNWVGETFGMSLTSMTYDMFRG